MTEGVEVEARLGWPCDEAMVVAVDGIEQPATELCCPTIQVSRCPGESLFIGDAYVLVRSAA